MTFSSPALHLPYSLQCLFAISQTANTRGLQSHRAVSDQLQQCWRSASLYGAYGVIDVIVSIHYLKLFQKCTSKNINGIH